MSHSWTTPNSWYFLPRRPPGGRACPAKGQRGPARAPTWDQNCEIIVGYNSCTKVLVTSRNFKISHGYRIFPCPSINQHAMVYMFIYIWCVSILDISPSFESISADDDSRQGSLWLTNVTFCFEKEDYPSLCIKMMHITILLIKVPTKYVVRCKNSKWAKKRWTKQQPSKIGLDDYAHIYCSTGIQTSCRYPVVPSLNGGIYISYVSWLPHGWVTITCGSNHFLYR